MATSSFPCMYHVFLSFRGEDTRKTFTDHLYTALLNAGFRTFRDDNSLERGNNIQSELQRAIQESRVSIIVLSKDYASSSWCLDELAMILEWKRKRSATTSRHEVIPVFYSVDPSHVRNQKGSFEEAFVRYEERILKAEVGSESRNEWVGKVEIWRAALREVADLAGMNLQNQADGHESNFIHKIVKVVEDKVSHTFLSVAPYPIGIQSRAQNILFWLQDESADVHAVAICGMGGIGKTTIAKFVYNLNFSRFERSSFLANIRETSEQQDGLVRLQTQLFSDILKGRTEKIYNVDEGIAKIKDALYRRRVLLVLDDVDNQEQLDSILGMRDWFYPGSKIIITTRNEQLVRACEICKVYMVKALDNQESLELLSWHAFGQDHPPDGYLGDSKRVLQHCGGLPLAIKVLGSSLVGKSLDIWKSQLEKLKVVPDNKIFEKLKMSYDSLQDDHDRELFLHIACFFVGKDKNDTITILDGCDFYSMVGIQNLIDRCLLTIDEKNKLSMHRLLQDMGKEIVHQESPKEPGERSRLWNHKDSFNVLREKTGTRKIEGFILDMQLLKRDNSARIVFGVNRKRPVEETFGKTLLSNLENSLKRYRSGIFSRHPGGTIAGNSDEVALETDAFSKMHKLKLLWLSYVQLSGSFENFPKGLRWLCWDGFPLKYIPDSFPLESLIALEMPYNNLNSIWQGTKVLGLLKILNLSHSQSLVETPDFSVLPNLERLKLKNCARLVNVHESIGQLKRLVLFNLEDCKSLRKLPRSIGKLNLEIFNISGCSSLDEFPIDLGKMESLKVLHVDRTDISLVLYTTGKIKSQNSFAGPWLFKPRKAPEILQISLPRSLVSLSLAGCNLSDDAFPSDLTNLSSLQNLNLSKNPICNLPDFIRGLTGLQSLDLSSCPRIQTVVRLQNSKSLMIRQCAMLKEITYVSPKQATCMEFGCVSDDNLVEITDKFEFEPLKNVDTDITGFSNLGRLHGMRLSRSSLNSYLRSGGVFSTFLSGRMVPTCFHFKNTGSSISVNVPSRLNCMIQGLSVCCVYGFSDSSLTNSNAKFWGKFDITIGDSTEWLEIQHPRIYSVPEVDEDMLWLSYWEWKKMYMVRQKFENQLEGDVELKFSVNMREDFLVKEVGIRLVCTKE